MEAHYQVDILSSSATDEIVQRLAAISWPSCREFRTGEIKREIARRMLAALTNEDCETLLCVLDKERPR